MSFVNLTPHEITIIGAETIVVPPSGTVARVSSVSVPSMPRDGVECTVFVFGGVQGLPEPAAGVTFIVSGMVLDACNRSDLAAPGVLVRDDAGQPIGCRGLRVRA